MKAIFFEDFENSYIPHILKEIYIDKIYDRFLQNKKDLIIFDIGANIGLFSFYAVKFAKKIYAVEPSTEHLAVLQTMLAYNKFDNVEVVPAAIGGIKKIGTLYKPQNTTCYSLLPNIAEIGVKKPEIVPVITIEELFIKYNIDYCDFMKLDIEGTELEVFASEAFEKVADKIHTIIFEYHDWSNTNPNQLLAVLRDRGFKADWLSLTEAKLGFAIKI